MFTDKNGLTEVQFLRSHRPLARRLTELEAENEALRQQLEALTPPEGFVLMPRVLTEEMLQAGYPADDAQEGYEAMIAARPEVP